MSTAQLAQLTLGGATMNVPFHLIQKYNRPGPRYTSYPTIPEWSTDFKVEDFEQSIARTNQREQPRPVSLYFHLPFCESLCLYCACTTVITKNHAVVEPYLAQIKREVGWVSEHLDAGRQVEQIHFGGGTPTFLTPDQLVDLYGAISSQYRISPTAEISIEIDPRVTSPEHCRTLRELGFNRVSLGVQDFSPEVQKTVHRIQSYAMVKQLNDTCRDLGFDSINIDLIYGLPHQTLESFLATVDQVIEIQPDRIALFSYAHVPWMKRQQKILEKHLPPSEVKFEIFTQAIAKLTGAGYRYVGMDHFALEKDELCRAQDDRTLHRNFQGYTTKANCDLFGFGMSSISGLEDTYAQHWHTLPNYYETAHTAAWPLMRGCQLTADDKLRRAVISRILCHTLLVKSEIEREFGISFDRYFAPELETLTELEQDQLVTVSSDRIEATPLGRILIRNIAMTFDAYLKKPVEQRFSKTL